MLEFTYMEVPFAGAGVKAYRPVVMFVIEGPTGKRINIDLLVDTGADSVLLPIGIAKRLDVELAEVPDGATRSVSGDEIPYFGGRVFIEVRQPPSIVRWSAKVAFADNPLRSLFGQRGGLEFFHSHFLGPEHRLMLEAQPTLPTAL